MVAVSTISRSRTKRIQRASNACLAPLDPGQIGLGCSFTRPRGFAHGRRLGVDSMALPGTLSDLAGLSVGGELAGDFDRWRPRVVTHARCCWRVLREDPVGHCPED